MVTKVGEQRIHAVRDQAQLRASGEIRGCIWEAEAHPRLRPLDHPGFLIGVADSMNGIPGNGLAPSGILVDIAFQAIPLSSVNGPVAVPESGTLALVSLGFGVLPVRRWARSRQQALTPLGPAFGPVAAPWLPFTPRTRPNRTDESARRSLQVCSQSVPPRGVSHVARPGQPSARGGD
jgi:hypothetical protein